MIAAWMLVSLAVSLPIAAAAWCADRLAGEHGRARRLPWAVALAALVLLTALAPLRREPVAPAVALPAVATVTTTTAVDDAPWHARLPRTLVAAVGDARDAVGTVAARAAALDPRAQRTLAAAWGVATLAMLGTLALAWRRMTHARRTWPRADIDGVPVRVAQGGAPAVVGLGRAMEIVVPAWVTALPPARRALVLAHEREHVHARDPWLLALGAATVALLPWHPAAWWLAARLATAIETDCDARVLAAGADVRDYGALLLDVAAGRCAPSLLAPWPALGGRRSTLETRIRAMTDRRRSPHALVSAVTGAVVVACTVVACDSGKLPTSAEVEKMDAQAVQARVLTVMPLEATGPQGKVTWYVDDKAVSEAEAKAIGPERIASIDVRKQVGRDTASVIRITTRTASAPMSAITERGTGDTLIVVRDTVAIRRIDIRSLDSAGGPGKERSTVIFLKDTVNAVPGASTRVIAMPAGATTATPLYFIDGVKAGPDALTKLPPARIASVEVIKGAAATAQYGAEGANGVIRITTKK